ARSFASTRPTLPEPRFAVAGGPAQRTQGGGVRGAGPPAAARSIAAPQPSTAANAHRENTSADHEPPARSRTRSKSASGANAPYTPAPAPPSRLRQNAPASGLPADNSTAACSCTANAATSHRACACSIDAPSAPPNRASPAPYAAARPPTDSRNDTSAAPVSGSRASARSTSRHWMLPLPSQIELSGACRYSRGSSDSSTYPAPPRHSCASLTNPAARLQIQNFPIAVAIRANA